MCSFPNRRCVPWRDPEDESSYCVFHPYFPERLFLTLQGLDDETGSSLMVGDSKGCITIKILVEVIGLPEVGSVLTSFAGGFKIQDKASKVWLFVCKATKENDLCASCVLKSTDSTKC